MTLKRDLNKLVDQEGARTALPAAEEGRPIPGAVGIAAMGSGREADGAHVLKPPLRMLITATVEKQVVSDDGDVTVTVEDAAAGKIVDAEGAVYSFTVEWPAG